MSLSPYNKVAIVFFGLTRTLSSTIDSIKSNLLNVLSELNMEYDIFIHTYKINGKYKNNWSNEFVENYVNEDIEQLLNPKYFIFDNQDEIIEKINFDEYYSKLGNWTGMSKDMTKYLIRNLVLALYSKKRITEILEIHKEKYEYVIFIRPDTLLLNKVWIDYSTLTDYNIIIPDAEWHRGCNDRFAICATSVALYYGFMFDFLLEYSKHTSIISEKYLLDMLTKKKIAIITQNINYKTLRIKPTKNQKRQSNISILQGFKSKRIHLLF